jgi:hypothetical protein
MVRGSGSAVGLLKSKERNAGVRLKSTPTAKTRRRIRSELPIQRCLVGSIGPGQEEERFAVEKLGHASTLYLKP